MQNQAAQASAIFFAPLLPWQTSLWEQVTTRAQNPTKPLPHALLASGMAGLGKRAFIWRLVAWLLCYQQVSHPMGACGVCESCHWLKSGTHPNLQVLPLANLPCDPQEPAATTNNDSTKKAAKPKDQTIKVDDIRAIQPFIYQGSQGLKICVIDNAEQMTIAAANALLKTLEEPQEFVHLMLITDSKAKLLPTINSRLQQLPIQQVSPKLAFDFVSQALGGVIQKKAATDDDIQQLLAISHGAPLAAIALAQSPWYGKRTLWLTTWQALFSKKRSAIAASDYWQNELSLTEFIALSKLMLSDIQRVLLGLPSVQQDIDFDNVLQKHQPSLDAIQQFLAELDTIKLALQQNVQDKVAYDKLMAQLGDF